MSRIRRAFVAAAALGLVAACIDLSGPDSGVVSISSLRIPYPSVVIGDIMRDSLGAPAPLRLVAFDVEGNEIPGEPVTYFTLDTTISIDADGTVHGLFRDSVGSRVVGSAGPLQTSIQRIIVTPPPQAVTKDAAETAIAFEITAPDTSARSNWSPPLTLRLSAASDAAVQGFIVSYEIVRSPVPITAGTPTAYVADDAGRHSRRDTTDVRGNAARRVVLRQLAVGDAALLAGTRTDTIVVRATVRYLGADVPGSPVDFFVPVKVKP